MTCGVSLRHPMLPVEKCASGYTVALLRTE